MSETPPQTHDLARDPRDVPAAPGARSYRLRSVRHLILDLDGTVYLGRRIFPWTLPFLELLRELGIGHSFVTNNNSRSLDEYLSKLHGIGLEVERSAIYTSTQATIEYLEEQEPRPRRLFVLGTWSLRQELVAAGFVDGEEPEAVIVGFDTSLIYERLCRAAYWIARGVPFIATHPDRVCPTDQPTVLPDCGSICALLERATGRAPDVVLGKPNPRVVQGILRGRGLSASEVAVVGDRLYTDMRMARDSGALGVLVLSGETTREHAKSEPGAADLVVENLEELGRLLREIRRV